MSAIPLDEQLAAVEREIRLRERVYPRWIESGKMTQARADREIAAMQGVAMTLRSLSGSQRQAALFA